MDPTPLLNAYRGTRLLILGSARGLWADLAALNDAKWPGHRMCIQHTGLLYDRLFEHWTGIHFDHPIFDPENRLRAIDRTWGRKSHPVLRHGKRNALPGIYQWSFADRGTSALFAVRVGLAMGYDEIVLAGVPLDDSGYFWDPPGRTTENLYRSHLQRADWEAAADEWDGRVTSLSGLTRDILGAPDGF